MIEEQAMAWNLPTYINDAIDYNLNLKRRAISLQRNVGFQKLYLKAWVFLFVVVCLLWCYSLHLISIFCFSFCFLLLFYFLFLLRDSLILLWFSSFQCLIFYIIVSSCWCCRSRRMQQPWNCLYHFDLCSHLSHFLSWNHPI